MVILTTKNISKLNPKKQSSSVYWIEQDYCLAEVDDNFHISLEEMEALNIWFYWELAGGHFDANKFPLKSEYNLVEQIYNTYDVSKEQNIALGIYEVCREYGYDAFEFWEIYNKDK